MPVGQELPWRAMGVWAVADIDANSSAQQNVNFQIMEVSEIVVCESGDGLDGRDD